MYSLFGKGLSTKDTSALKQYVTELQKGVTVSQAANATLSGTSAAAKNVAKSIGQLTLDYRAGRISAEQYNTKLSEMQKEMTVTSTKAKVLGGVLRTAINVGLTMLITTLISLPNIIKNVTTAIKQQRQEGADSAKQQIDEVNELRNQYYELSEQVKTDSSAKDQLTSVTKQLLKKLGLEKDAVKELSDDYERLNSKINEATLSSLQEAEGNLRAVLADSASIETKNDFTPYGQGDYRVLDEFAKRVIKTSSNLGEYRKIIHDIVNEFEGSEIDFQDSMITFDVSNLDAIKKSYKDVTDLLLYINEEYGDSAQQLTLYRSLASIQIELQSNIDKYNTSLSNLNDNIAQQVVLNGLVGREIPKTTEEFEKFKQELIDGIYYTNEEGKAVTKFAGITEDNMELAVNAIISILSQMPEFKKFFEIDEKTDDGYINPIKTKISELSNQLETLKEAVDSAFSNQSTIQSAFDKIQKGSSLSADEVRKLVEICPEIATEFKKTVDGYTISSNALIKANDNIIQSTKESVETQIKGYQEVIDKYNEIKNVASMPESARQDRLKALGITEDDIKNAEQQINQYRLILGMLGITLGEDASQVEKLKEKYEELSKVGSSLSSKMKSLSSAFKEQKENGELSADTILSIIENGYAAALMYDKETGKVKLNEQAYLNLAKAELTAYEADLQTQISNAELQLLDAKRSIVSNLGWSYLDTAEAALKLAEAEATINNNPELIENLKAQLLVVQELKDGLGSVVTGEYGGSGSGSSTDTLKDAFQKRQKELEHLLNMEQITEAEYYKQLFDSKEYKALLADRTKYADELNSIDEKYYKFQQDKYKEDADKQFDDLEDQRKRGIITAEQYAQAIHDLGQELYGEDSIYGGTEFAIKALEEVDKKVKDVSDDIYSELKDSLSADGDRLLDDVLADADELSKKNIELFRNTGDLKTFKKNAEDIFKTVSASAKDALERGLITPERFKEIIDQYSQGLDSGIIQDIFDDGFDAIADKAKDNLDKMLITPDEYFKLLDEWGKKLNISKDVIDKLKEAVSESDYLNRWDLDNGYDENKSKDDYDLRAKRIEYIYELAEQLYGKNGQKNLKAYNALINQGLEDVESLVEDYYDAEIKKLEKINDEEEKRQKALELQLNLIKARQKLEEAKSQKNQLVFHNGTFEYMADQEAVMSAEEDLAEAQKAILEQEREDQIKALEDQKAETLKFFNSVGGKLDDFINRVKRFLSGDKDAFKVDESKVEIGSGTKSDNESNANSVTTTTGSKDKTITSATDKTEINADNVEVKTDTGTSAVADTTDTATTEEPVVSINDLVSNIDANVTGISETATAISDATKGIFDTAKAFANGFNFENLVRALGGNPTAEAVKNFQDSYNATLVGKQIAPSTLPSNITNNSSTTNNSAKTVNIGDINLHFDLTLNSLDEFVDGKIDDALLEVGRYVKQKLPAILAKA